MEQIKSDFSKIETDIMKMDLQRKNLSIDVNLQNHLEKFLPVNFPPFFAFLVPKKFFQESLTELKKLQKKIDDLETIKNELSEYFCEETTTFKIEECFKSLHMFFCKFKKVSKTKYCFQISF